MKGPLIIHSFKDGIEDSLTAGSGGKGTHFADSAAHFDKGPFDYIGGANSPPMFWGAIEEG